MPEPAQKPQDAEAPELSWGSMLRTNRVVVGMVFVIGIGLLFMPQTRDMLSGMADRWNWTIAFQCALWLMAFNGWYWSRAVLSARFEIGDTRDDRKKLETRTGKPKVETQALNLFPRLVFVAIASVGLLAAARSLAWGQAIIIGIWLVISLVLLTRRLRIQAWFGFEDLTAADRAGETPGAKPTFWRGLWWTVRTVAAHAPFGRVFTYVLLAAAVLCFTVGAALSFVDTSWRMEPSWWLGYYLPGPSAVLICLGLAIGPLTLLTYWFDLIHIDGRFLGIDWYLRRFPLFTILIAALLFIPALLELHRVRIVPPETKGTKPDQRVTLGAAFKRWAAACAPGNGTIRPIIVAISGGASAAGLWGARVLEEVDGLTDGAPGTSIFAISSVSGGSLGAAAYLATIGGSSAEPKCRADPAKRNQRREAVHEALGSDFLGPFMASALFGDVPRAFLGPLVFWIGEFRGGDRADGLEQAFERRWSESTHGKVPAVELSDPFLSLYRSSGDKGGPIWIANGTDAQGGNRLLTVPFRPATAVECAPGDTETQPCGWPFSGGRDVLQILNADVPISTAVHNTARFPFLSPSGALVAAGSGPWPVRAHIIDGGYFDNAGLLTAEELGDWLVANKQALAGGRAVEPIIVEVTTAFANRENSKVVRCKPYEPDDPTNGAGEWSLFHFFAPVSGLNAVRGGHADAEFRRARTGRCESGPGSLFHFYLFDEGKWTVPMNWTLSDGVGKYIWNAALYDRDNCAELQRLKVALRSAAPLRSCGPEP